jgi:hypothetical protein
MADIAQVIATGGTALVSAAAGAELTYWLGALNRRHQEAREDRTRWYEERLKAYVEFTRAAMEAGFLLKGDSAEDWSTIIERFESAMGTMLLTSSPEVHSAGLKVLRQFRDHAETELLMPYLSSPELQARTWVSAQSQAERHVAFGVAAVPVGDHFSV